MSALERLPVTGNTMERVVFQIEYAHRKHGDYWIGGSRLNDHQRLAVLAAELGEVAEHLRHDKPRDHDGFVAELSQVAACALTWLNLVVTTTVDVGGGEPSADE